MHEVKINRSMLDTDLIIEKNLSKNNLKITNYNNIKVINNKIDNYKYTTISFKDITDKTNYNNLLKVFIKELKKYLKITSKDSFLVVGLGNIKSTPDSLGPYTIENILVTRYLYKLGDVDKNYSNVCSFSPNVTGNTGIETSNIIKSLIKETKVTYLIVIDALKTNNINRLTKTIQITNKGISPGSGIGNKREEISDKNTNIKIIAIGVPTVLGLNNNFIVTPTSIDFTIEKLAHLLSDGINISLHKNFRHNNN